MPILINQQDCLLHVPIKKGRQFAKKKNKEKKGCNPFQFYFNKFQQEELLQFSE